MSDARDARNARPATPAKPAAPAPPPLPQGGGSPRPPLARPASPKVGAARPAFPTTPGVGEAPPPLPKVELRGEPKPEPKPAANAPAPDLEATMDQGWDDADTIATADTPRVAGVSEAVAQPTVATPRPPPPGAAAPPPRDDVAVLVRAAVDEATTPLVAKIRELEERAERAEREARAARAASGASIPVAVSTSLAPPVIHVPAASSIPQFKRSLPPSTYGVAVIERVDAKPDLDLSNVGPIEMPDFAGRSKLVTRIIALVVVLILGGVVTMTVLSHR